MEEVIRSLENKKIKLFASLKLKKNRDKNKLFLVEERHLIEEAYQKGDLQYLICLESKEPIVKAETIYVSESVMRKLQSNDSLNQYIGVCKTVDLPIKKYDSLVVLQNVQIPGNVGTIIRTAYAFGYDGIILTDGCADIYNEKTIQASQGALFSLPIVRCSLNEAVSLLKENNCKIIATALRDSIYLKEAPRFDKYAILLGNEGNGLTKEAIDSSDVSVKIEMENFESLNVAAAAAIALYHFKY